MFHQFPHKKRSRCRRKALSMGAAARRVLQYIIYQSCAIYQAQLELQNAGADVFIRYALESQ